MSLAAFVMIGIGPRIARGDTIFVCWDGSGHFTTIREAMDAGRPGDEIVVCDGVYTGPLNKNLDFNGKPMIVRSANGPENCIIDCENFGRAFHFFFEGRDSIVDGFTIRNGYASFAGAIYCSLGTAPTIRNCVITENFGETAGAVVCGSALFRNCLITRNSTNGWGGGVLCNNDQRPTLVNCVITDNTAGFNGGGMACLERTSARLVNCRISGNTAGNNGGGVWIEGGFPTIMNCEITDNTAADKGGGLGIANEPQGIYRSCIIARNTASKGGGIFCVGGVRTISNCTIFGNSADLFGGAVYSHATNDTTIVNSVLWGNSAPDGPEIALEEAILAVAYSNVQGGPAGAYSIGSSTLEWLDGNLNTDPLFVDPAAGDFHLLPTSPGIRSGDPGWFGIGESDLDGEPRVMGGRVDMGVDEFTDRPFVFGDMNCDGVRNGVDIDPFFLALGDPPAYAARHPNCDPRNGDCNDDGAFNGADIEAFYCLLGRVGCSSLRFPLGDLNCDGDLNGSDVDPFFLALRDPAAYTSAFPECEILLGDMNNDARVNGGDIDPFFQCLAGQCP